MHDERPAAPDAVGHLSLWDTVSVIVGIVIGAGIYETPPLILQNVSGPGMALAAWMLGGLLSFNGALTYAELASTYPRSGGDYVYLTRAYGPMMGFLFGWAQLTVILTGSIGMMAYVFADYASRLWQFHSLTTLLYAGGAVALLTLLNMFGVVLGKRVQNALSTTKILGLALVLLAGLLMPAEASGTAAGSVAAVSASSGPAFSSFAFALVLVFITYGGWNDAAFFVAEMQDRKHIVRALFWGIAIITATYILINFAYLHSLGFDAARQSNAVAADVAQRAIGPNGAHLVSLLVMISALGAVNGLIFAGSRVFATLGQEHPLFARLAKVHPQFGSPVWSLLAQGCITLAMILLIGTTAGQSALDEVFTSLGLPHVAWGGRGGFDTLLRCTAPVFWLFFLLTSLALFILRVKDATVPRPFTAPLFPLCPLLFSATCGYMLYSGMQYAGSLGLVGGAFLLAGLPVYAVSRRIARLRGERANVV
jgi:basic amino acid/polyamine antiporter, APA family